MPRKSRDELTNEKAKKLFCDLCRVYAALYGSIDDTALHIINDCATLEQLKQTCLEDVRVNGTMVAWSNGAQSGKRENPLLPRINQTTEQQRKLLVELKLTPARRKLIAPVEGDEFENF